MIVVLLVAPPILCKPFPYCSRLFFELGIKILLLDTGYYSIDVINLLNSLRINIIMMARDTGKFNDGDDLMHTTSSHRHLASEQVTFRVVAFNGKMRSGKIVLLIFATNTELKAKKIRKIFKKRWAIETSYRMINQFLPKTTSKNYSIRKLYFYLAVLFYNIWVLLNYKHERVMVERVKLAVILEMILPNVILTADG